ncbi:MAG: TetR/AcrR family transcriptional regulator [Deltaproteobacteria bacterium]|nr:MAG: TetR/AcrR family transcriptional regulator [Deltaproteobacteria bacterium]
MTRHRSPEERRAQILDAAKKCFIRDGFAHTRVDDIAREAGLSKGGIYFHFSSKREIFDALHDLEYERNMAVLASIGQEDIPASEKLTRMANQMVTYFHGNEEHRRFLIVLGEMGMREPEVHARILDSHRSYVDALTEIIEAGADSGEFRELSPRGVAMFLKLLIDGIEQGFALGYEIDIPDLITTGLALVQGGLLAGGDR